MCFINKTSLPLNLHRLSSVNKINLHCLQPADLVKLAILLDKNTFSAGNIKHFFIMKSEKGSNLTVQFKAFWNSGENAVNIKMVNVKPEETSAGKLT